MLRPRRHDDEKRAGLVLHRLPQTLQTHELNGEKDIQVDAAMNLAAIQERITGNGNKNVTVKAYPNLNHLFQTCEKGTLTEYGQLEETINPEVLKDIIEWIRKQ